MINANVIEIVSNSQYIAAIATAIALACVFSACKSAFAQKRSSFKKF